MLELITCYILMFIGYMLGSFIEWKDHKDGPDSRRVTKPIEPEDKRELCQDYSHLKYKAMARKPPDISLTHMPSEDIHEKVYDVEVVEDETYINKII